ncbi:MAG: LysM peptidoglycan-binding domain-containing protein, partial [Duncaniella sp.]|nr:LysM peptidoglycan-binding domain-containing protein [Duncaniella sp.]
HYSGNPGISPTSIKRLLTTDTVTGDKYIHFNQIAAVLNIPVDEIRMLNPQFLKDVIPGDYRPYTLTLPTQQCLSYVMSEKRIADYDSELYARRSHVEPGSQPAEPVLPESDHGAANLASASRQSVNAETNNEIATTSLVEQMTVKTHIVDRGESIRDIARKYGVSATDIKRWNHLRRGKVREGDTLRIETFERINPENIKVVAAPEVAQVTPQELREAGATELVAAVAKASGLSSESASTTPAKTAPAKTTPAKTAAAPKKAAPATTVYSVRKGDNLGKIAARYGTTVAAIQAANGMGTKTALQIGQKLKIPQKQAKKSTSRRRRR